jgi:hypothetical protein
VVVLVGQWRALALAVRDWRRSARQTALAGLLRGELRFAWSRPVVPADGTGQLPSWEGLIGDEAAGAA